MNSGLESRYGLGIQDLGVFSVLRALHSLLTECSPERSQETILKHISDHINGLASNCRVQVAFPLHLKVLTNSFPSQAAPASFSFFIFP